MRNTAAIAFNGAPAPDQEARSLLIVPKAALHKDFYVITLIRVHVDTVASIYVW